LETQHQASEAQRQTLEARRQTSPRHTAILGENTIPKLAYIITETAGMTLK
jgi:hypothetical protein